MNAMVKALLFAVFVLAFAGGNAQANTAIASASKVRIKDIARVAGVRENQLVGYGLVTGLAGTGDSPRNIATRQSIANMLSRFDLAVPADLVQSRNVAAVSIVASLPAQGRAGDAFDITVTSLGDARSLSGGTLLLAPLKAVDGKVYALAQGPVTVGGYKLDANGNAVQKNHPTTGSVPNGATIERLPEGEPGRDTLLFVLAAPDYTTATRVAAAIAAQFGAGAAQARDAAGIEVRVPAHNRSELASFIAQVEQIPVAPDQRARIVINERTGTIVMGDDVTISRVTVAHGELKVSVNTEFSTSQPLLIGQAGDGIRTETIANTRMQVSESDDTKVVTAAGTVGDLVRALARMRVSARDIVSILRAVKAAGALHAELVVQ
jgi:flagellar P-ring protein FlgI